MPKAADAFLRSPGYTAMKFPSTFKFGWSQAGFQSEMGTPGSEDPNTDWYVWVHDPENLTSSPP